MTLRPERKETLRQFGREVAGDVKNDLLHGCSSPAGFVAAAVLAIVGVGGWLVHVLIVDRLSAMRERRRGFDVTPSGSVPEASHARRAKVSA